MGDQSLSTYADPNYFKFNSQGHSGVSLSQKIMKLMDLLIENKPKNSIIIRQILDNLMNIKKEEISIDKNDELFISFCFIKCIISADYETSLSGDDAVFILNRIISALQNQKACHNKVIYFFLETLENEEFWQYISMFPLESNTLSLLITSLLFLEDILTKEVRLRFIVANVVSYILKHNSVAKDKERIVLYQPLFEIFSSPKATQSQICSFICQEAIKKLPLEEKQYLCQFFSYFLRGQSEYGEQIQNEDQLLSIVYFFIKSDGQNFMDFVIVLDSILKERQGEARNSMFLFLTRVCQAKNSKLASIFSRLLISVLISITHKDHLLVRKKLVTYILKFMKNNLKLIEKQQSGCQLSDQESTVIDLMLSVNEAMNECISSSLVNEEEKLYILDKCIQLIQCDPETFTIHFYEELIKEVQSSSNFVREAAVKQKIYQLFGFVFYQSCLSLAVEDEAFDFYDTNKNFSQNEQGIILSNVSRKKETARKFLELLKTILHDLISMRKEEIIKVHQFLFQIIFPTNCVKIGNNEGVSHTKTQKQPSYDMEESQPDEVIKRSKSFEQHQERRQQAAYGLLCLSHNLYGDLYRTQSIDCSNSLKYDIFIFQVLGSDWQFDYDNIFTNNSFLNIQGLLKIVSSKFRIRTLLREVLNFLGQTIQYKKSHIEEREKIEKRLGDYFKNSQTNDGKEIMEAIESCLIEKQEFQNHFENILNDDDINASGAFDSNLSIDFVIKAVQLQGFNLLLACACRCFVGRQEVQLLAKFLDTLIKDYNNFSLAESCLKLLLDLVQIDQSLASEKCAVMILENFQLNFDFIKSYPESVLNSVQNEPTQMEILDLPKKKEMIKPKQKTPPQEPEEYTIAQTRAAQIIQYFLSLISQFALSEIFPADQNPEDLSDFLQKEVRKVNTASSTNRNGGPMFNFNLQMIQKALKIITELDIICSSKNFPKMVEEAVQNIDLRGSSSTLYHISVIYVAMKHCSNRIEISSFLDQKYIFMLFTDLINQPDTMPRSNLVSQLSLCKQMLMECSYKSITQNFCIDYKEKLVSLFNTFSQMLISSKEFSVTSMMEDENYLRIHVLQLMFKLITDNDLYSNIPASKLLGTLSLLAFDVNNQFRKILFHVILKKYHQVNFCMFTPIFFFCFEEEKSTLNYLSSSSLIAFASSYQKSYAHYLKECQVTVDVESNIAYYAFFLYHAMFNHPLFALNEINFKNIYKLFIQFFDVISRDRFVDNVSVLIHIIETLQNFLPIIEEEFRNFTMEFRLLQFKTPKLNHKVLDPLLNQPLKTSNFRDLKQSQNPNDLNEIKEKHQKIINFLHEAVKQKIEVSKYQNSNFVIPKAAQNFSLPYGFFNKIDSLVTSKSGIGRSISSEKQSDHIEQYENKDNKKSKIAIKDISLSPQPSSTSSSRDIGGKILQLQEQDEIILNSKRGKKQKNGQGVSNQRVGDHSNTAATSTSNSTKLHFNVNLSKEKPGEEDEEGQGTSNSAQDIVQMNKKISNKNNQQNTKIELQEFQQKQIEKKVPGKQNNNNRKKN